MAEETKNAKTKRVRRNQTVAAVCVAFFVGMIGMSYAAVPLYRMFCQVTGYGGTTQRVEQYSDTVLDREITVRFDANTSGGIPWDFKPVQREVSMRIGETVRADFTAKNVAGAATRGRATFNVAPALAGAYFNKVECFCFTDTTLKPGETLDMPVVFFIDPDIAKVAELKDVHTITLSYTFFPLKGEEPLAAAPEAAAQQSSKLGG